MAKVVATLEDDRVLEREEAAAAPARAPPPPPPAARAAATAAVSKLRRIGWSFDLKTYAFSGADDDATARVERQEERR